MNPWKRKWFFYKAVMIHLGNGFTVERTTKLDFISYHMIKRIHGEKKLIQMAEVDSDGLRYVRKG